jgi:hypothetical protein
MRTKLTNKNTFFFIFKKIHLWTILIQFFNIYNFNTFKNQYDNELYFEIKIVVCLS